MTTLGEELSRIAAIDPDSPIGIALKLVADRISKDEARRSGSRSRTAKWRAKRHGDGYGDVTVTRHGNVTVTVTEKCIDSIGTIIDCTNTNLTELDKIYAAKQSKRSARGVRLPENWLASFEDRAFARAAGFSEEEIDRLQEDFRDYWIAQPGSKGVKLDWSATWRRWARTALERRNPANVSRFPARPITPGHQILRHNLEQQNVVANGQLPHPDDGPAASYAGRQVEVLPALAQSVAKDVPCASDPDYHRKTNGHGFRNGKLL